MMGMYGESDTACSIPCSVVVPGPPAREATFGTALRFTHYALLLTSAELSALGASLRVVTQAAGTTLVIALMTRSMASPPRGSVRLANNFRTNFIRMG